VSDVNAQVVAPNRIDVLGGSYGQGVGGSGAGELETLNKILPHLSYLERGVGGKPTVQFSGVNVQVVSGAGKTRQAHIHIRRKRTDGQDRIRSDPVEAARGVALLTAADGRAWIGLIGTANLLKSATHRRNP
jgi:hypothetical protein